MSGATGCDSGPSIEEVRKLQSEARFADSLEPLRALLKVQPDDPEINFRYGAALSRTTSSPVAVWSLRKAAEDPKWAVRANMELASASVRTSSIETAIEAATAVLDADPEHLAARRLRGQAYLNGSNEPELAREDFEILLDINPNDSESKASLAATLLVLGEVDEAERLLLEIDEFAQDGNAVESTRALLCATRATLEAERGEIEHGEEMIEACLEMFPTDTVVVEQAVALLDQIGKPDRSTVILNAALEATPGNAGFRSALSNRALAAGDVNKAEAILIEATTLPDPATRAWAWTTLTNFYLERDDLDGATEAYQEAIDLSPDPSQLALLTLADLLARGERHEEALEVSKRLENDTYRGLIEARVHLNELRPAEALARLDQVFLNWPNNAGARYYAARAAEQMGDFERAIEEYRQSIRSDSKQTEAGLRLAKIYLAAGSLQNAWNSASQYFRIHREDAEGVRVLLRAATVAHPDSVRQLFGQLQGSPQWPTALSIRAVLVESRQGVEAALAVIDDAQAVDLTMPAFVELLRTKVRLELELGRSDAARAAADAALAARDDFGPFLEVHGFVLERTGAPTPEIRAAYSKAVERAPRYWVALESLGRLEEKEGNLEAALALYRRAVEASPEQDSPGRAIARALEAADRLEEAEIAWETQLREHPWDAQTALALTRLRSRVGKLDDRTLELAERAVLFQGGPEAQQQLVETHKARGEEARAQSLTEAIEAGKPLPPMQITPIDRV
jgi:tetratricopeptide (TPR) repeat protein